MSPDAQRIAIAEACGWTFSKIKGEFRYVAIDPKGPVFHPNFGDVSFLPDYLADLNAMHDAEKMLTTDAQCDEYNSRIEAMVNGKAPNGWKWHATAAQRAEAFLRTLNKWDDTK